MSLQLPAILSPPTPCIPFPTLTVSPWLGVTLLPFSLSGQLSVLGFAFPSQARQCIRPYRVQHGLVYGLAVRLRLLPTPSLDDAVTFNYGQPVLCPTGTFTPLFGAHSQAHEAISAANPKQSLRDIDNNIRGTDSRGKFAPATLNRSRVNSCFR